ncbi:hypothetical protein [Halopiger goleimassiliensis]|uniref:hypothetical protein n=1 Tax=Halopiger goleimassiliensis TaxID=1293048 RepID=UPI0006782C01|nr:hypothetical protein [Halopiger goleimassiliensis]
MVRRDVVTETIAEAALVVDVPIERGDELAAGAQDALESLAVVRYADVREIGEVDAGESGLAVSVDCRLTLHVDPDAPDESAGSDSVRDLERVLEIDRFETVDGPYRVEA